MQINVSVLGGCWRFLEPAPVMQSTWSYTWSTFNLMESVSNEYWIRNCKTFRTIFSITQLSKESVIYIKHLNGFPLFFVVVVTQYLFWIIQTDFKDCWQFINQRLMILLRLSGLQIDPDSETCPILCLQKFFGWLWRSMFLAVKSLLLNRLNRC